MAWPPTLPGISIEGYGVNPIDPAIRSQMEGSNTKARRITKVRSDKVPVTWEMTDAQFYTFRLWFDDPAGANGGTSWFTIDAKTGNTASGMETVTAIFDEVWKATLVSPGNWSVSAVLEVRYA